MDPTEWDVLHMCQWLLSSGTKEPDFLIQLPFSTSNLEKGKLEAKQKHNLKN